MLVECPELKIDGEQDYSAVSEISLTRGELNRFSADYFQNNFNRNKG